MEQHITLSGIAPHGWLQHYVPWLGLFTLIMNLFRDDPAIGFDPDDMNG